LTLVLALKWIREGKEGVVSSDSRATIGPVSYEVRKVYPIGLREDNVPLAVAGGAGDSSLVKQG